jgi:hypothetical protein
MAVSTVSPAAADESTNDGVVDEVERLGDAGDAQFVVQITPKAKPAKRQRRLLMTKGYRRL